MHDQLGQSERTYSWHARETWVGIWYLQSMIMVSVSLSLASWKGALPVTSMKRITPRLQTSAIDACDTGQYCLTISKALVDTETLQWKQQGMQREREFWNGHSGGSEHREGRLRDDFKSSVTALFHW